MFGLSEIVAVNDRAVERAREDRVTALLQEVADALAAIKVHVDEGDWGIVEAGRVGGTLSLMSDGLPRIAEELGLSTPKLSDEL